MGRAALYVGIMSGTSMDGADGVLAEMDAAAPRLLAGRSTPYPPALRSALQQLQRDARAPLDDALQLDAQLGEWLAQEVSALLREAGVAASAVRAIGCHGQTVRHFPDGPYPRTLQIGDLARVAARTGITTVGDFRRADVAAGGQGAPLAPLFHAVLFRPAVPAAVLNLGGIANLSLLDANEAPRAGFDSGPGNALLDGWIERTRGERYDANGRFAASGKVHAKLLESLLQHPYFERPPPKSTGRDAFSLAWVDTVLAGSASAGAAPADVQATLAELTACSAAQALARHGGTCRRVILCGGGVYNDDLVRRLRAALAGYELISSDHFGVAPLQVEALMVAWLAAARMRGRRLSTGPVTGARRRVCLGAVHRP